MSKFTFSREGIFHVLNTNGIPQARYTEKALIELRAAIDAHLAEQNSRVMGGAECKCGAPPEFSACGMPFNPSPRIEDFCINAVGVMKCGHPKVCHSTQSTENQGE